MCGPCSIEMMLCYCINLCSDLLSIQVTLKGDWELRGQPSDHSQLLRNLRTKTTKDTCKDIMQVNNYTVKGRIRFWIKVRINILPSKKES